MADQRLRNVGVAALAAVSQYPRAVNEENSSFLVSEVVNAVTGDFHTSPAFDFSTRSRSPGCTDSDMVMESAFLSPEGSNDDDTTMKDTYEPIEHHPSTADSDDDLDLLHFYPGEEHVYRRDIWIPEADINLDDFYQRVNYDTPDINPEAAADTTESFPDESGIGELHPTSIIHTATYERNLTVDEFIQRWVIQTTPIHRGVHAENRAPPVLHDELEPPLSIRRPHIYERGVFDLQQIPWADILKVKRSDARSLRDAWYTSYHNLDYHYICDAAQLQSTETFFREKAMHTAHKASIEHFQLRNLMSVPAYNTVHFASRSKIYSWTPDYDSIRCLIDLERPGSDAPFLGPVKISSMKTAHGLTIAGGFCGEYALAADEGAGAKGLVTPDPSDGITNHVDVVPNRTGRSPICVFASNDRHLRVLDCETNVFLSDQTMSRPINCTATSPDTRLRVVIGDSPDAWVIEADTGRPVHPLRGHRDFGFACAWSPDMRHIATSNQDKTVRIWDARTWRILETIDSDVAGYRSLRFSPVGGGPRTLLCSEPADRISILDAQLFQSRQVHDFFGEIGGADYSPDGSTIWVANTDPHLGGFMQYERRQWNAPAGVVELPNEWGREADLDGRCMTSAKERQLRFLRNLSDEEHDSFLF
ncbi:hypothetical protein N7495_004742 [Penicillium taxi]|uniref:uncharacterized protein n=1 Tax=Penicillium taxi TaxID=168475 RepID=UPI0025456D64|nr:uncharacterized protein N7495_004742 [Penicillium taxi]KAJ5899998.1 hypothetical protein N7495_004742 [Penicillium taxi]